MSVWRDVVDDLAIGEFEEEVDTVEERPLVDICLLSDIVEVSAEELSPIVDLSLLKNVPVTSETLASPVIASSSHLSVLFFFKRNFF